MNWTFLLCAMAALGMPEPLAIGKPQVTYVGMVAPNVVVVMIAAQSVEHGKQVPYKAQPGDEVVNWRQHRYVRRGEVRIAARVGAEGKILCTPDRLVGDPLDTTAMDQVKNYGVTCLADGRTLAVQAIFRKSKPVDADGECVILDLVDRYPDLLTPTRRMRCDVDLLRFLCRIDLIRVRGVAIGGDLPILKRPCFSKATRAARPRLAGSLPDPGASRVVVYSFAAPAAEYGE